MEYTLQEERQVSSRLQTRIQQLEAEGTASSTQLKDRDAMIVSLLAEVKELKHTVQEMSDLETRMPCFVDV